MSETPVVYSEEDAADAPRHTLRLVGTDIEIVVYPINATDLCLLINKGGVCCYRASLRNALTDIEPFTDPHPLIDDAFVIRDLAQARQLLASMTEDEIQERIRGLADR